MPPPRRAKMEISDAPKTESDQGVDDRALAGCIAEADR